MHMGAHSVFPVPMVFSPSHPVLVLVLVIESTFSRCLLFRLQESTTADEELQFLSHHFIEKEYMPYNIIIPYIN